MRSWIGTVLAALLAAAVLAQEAEAPERRPVQVREAILREKPSFLGRIVARLPYEALVEIEAEQEGTTWLQVRRVGGETSGWLKETALFPRAVAVEGAGGERRATATTRSLAGRGFNEKVEAAHRAELRKQGSSIDEGYRRLDALLQRPVFFVDPAEVPAFVRAGELGGGR